MKKNFFFELPLKTLLFILLFQLSDEKIFWVGPICHYNYLDIPCVFKRPVPASKSLAQYTIYFTLALVASLLPLKMEHSSGIAVDVPQKRPKNHQDNPNAASGKNTFELGQFNQSECDLSILISCKDRAIYTYSNPLLDSTQPDSLDKYGFWKCSVLTVAHM